MATHEAVLTQTRAGDRIEHRGHRSRAKKTITVGREWEVSLEGKVIGTVVYRLFSRERRTPGRTYVNARWNSPGWGYRADLLSPTIEAYSKKDAVEKILSRYKTIPVAAINEAELS